MAVLPLSAMYLKLFLRTEMHLNGSEIGRGEGNEITTAWQDESFSFQSILLNLQTIGIDEIWLTDW